MIGRGGEVPLLNLLASFSECSIKESFLPEVLESSNRSN
jgi:hypothetical protein